MNKEQVIKDLKQLLNSLETLPEKSHSMMIGNAGLPKMGNQEEDEELQKLRETSRDYKYLGKEFVISANASHTVEFMSLVGGFLSKFLTIVVKNAESLTEAMIEIANISVMGDPQLVNFNGVTDSTQRGTSFLFKDSQEVNFSVFGACNGQGLNMSLVNPNAYDVKVSIIVSGFNTTNEMVGVR